MKKRTVYNGGNVISEHENVILTHPQNSQDMNYHVYDLNKGIEYLVDIGDVCETEEEIEKYSGILFEELKELDTDMIYDFSWKQYEH